MPFSKKLSSLHRLAILERTLGAGPIEIPADGSEWTVSSGALAVLGLAGDGQSGIGRAVADLIHPEDRPGFFRAVALMQAETVPPSCVYRVRDASGQIRYIAVRFDVLSGDTGRPQRFLGVLRDVTEEAIADRAQDKIGRLLDTLMSGLDVDVVWRTDRTGRLLDHFAKGNLARTLRPSDFQWHRFITEDNARLIQAKITAGVPFSVAVDVQCEDGVVRRCVSRGFPLSDETGRIVEWCGVVSEMRPGSPSADDGRADLSVLAEYVTGAFIRAACGLLDWTHEEFARRSGLSSITVRRMASSPERLLGLFRRASVDAALRAFVEAGLALRLSNERKVLIGL